MATALSVADFLRLLFGSDTEMLSTSENLISQELESLYVWMIAQGKMTALWLYSSMLLLLYGLKNVFSYISAILVGIIRNRIVQDIRNDMFCKSVCLKTEYYVKNKEGDILSRFGNDIVEYEESVINSMHTFVSSVVNIVFYLTMLFYMEAKLTMVVLVSIPVIAFVISGLSRRLKRKSKYVQMQGSLLLSFTEEAVRGLRVIKSFNAIDYSNDRFCGQNRDYTKNRVAMFRKIEAASPISEFFGSIVVVTVLLVGTMMILKGSSNLTAELFVSYIMLFVLMLPPAKNLSTAISQMRRGKGCVERIREFLENQREEVITEGLELEELGDIELAGVSMAYDTEEVLHNVNIQIPKGEMVAIVGASGSGKSTIANLLLRFYDASSGKITLGGVNINDYSIKSWRKRVGIVSQETLLFNSSVIDNILYGSPESSRAQVEAAARAANAHEFIEKLPQGYDTYIGDGGSNLSGGQRQRLCIARVILSNPDLIILDEATSALDSESEQQVQKGIEEILKDRTAVVIAHRLSTIRAAQKIVVMEKGEVVEVGNHNELMSKHGVYCNLVLSGQ